ncbi:MAG: hypothetical protein GF364_19215 [Candidatus Lokiarchaeota archaeon]|nr:hypothetical protein [Candidatus Lokiarchaeota archaeon]
MQTECKNNSKYQSSKILCEKYPFIRNDIELCAWVDTKTNIQKLVIQKINQENRDVELSDFIVVRNRKICDIPVKSFQKIATAKNFKTKLAKMRASKKLEEIHLEPDEKFKCLKSWVAGIATAGFNALKVSTDVSIAREKIYPISSKLIRFLLYLDPSLIYELISMIERESMKEGSMKDTFLIANLTPIMLNLVNSGETFGKWEIKHRNKWMWNEEFHVYVLNEMEKIMFYILELAPPDDLFNQNPLFPKLLNIFSNNYGKENNTKTTQQNNQYRFRLIGVPPEYAIKLISVDPDQTVAEIKKEVQKAYRLCPILCIQLVLRGRVLSDKLKISRLRIDPNREMISVQATQSAGCMELTHNRRLFQKLLRRFSIKGDRWVL